LQQYAVLDADAIALTPTVFTDEAVATLPTNLITSYIALFAKEGFALPPPFTVEGKAFDYASQHVVILGGGTNVGRFAVQLAALAGVGTIITVAGTANEEALRKIGATHTLDRHVGVDELAAKIHSIVGEVEHIYDCANTDFTVACALFSPSSSDKKTKLRTLLPLDAFPRSDYPGCDAEMLDARNDQLQPYQKTFWASVTKWLEEGRVLPTEFRVVDGLDDVSGINAGLDAYGEFGRSGVAGVVVRI
jgi:NADPH2:quinone reductase